MHLHRLDTACARINVFYLENKITNFGQSLPVPFIQRRIFKDSDSQPIPEKRALRVRRPAGFDVVKCGDKHVYQALTKRNSLMRD